MVAVVRFQKRAQGRVYSSIFIAIAHRLAHLQRMLHESVQRSFEEIMCKA